MNLKSKRKDGQYALRRDGKKRGLIVRWGHARRKGGGGRNMGAAGLRRNKAKHNGKQSARTAVIT